MRKYVNGLFGLLIAAGIALQFVPVERTNPATLGGPEVSDKLQWALRRACYDCHSNETRWPLWAYVAPSSWFVIRDVELARSILNFSEWALYEPAHRVALRTIIGSTTASHRMPLWYYVSLHPDSSLTDTEIDALSAWSKVSPARESPPHR